jgi:phosphomannomutase
VHRQFEPVKQTLKNNMAIEFGTSRWRAVSADEFTFAGVRSVGAVRSVATSHLVDRDAEAHGLPVYETPVGFKYIGESINENKIVIGGEESAGLSIQGHHPEKDGILACLLAAEGVEARGASLTSGTEPVVRIYA